MPYQWDDEPPESAQAFLRERLNEHAKVRSWLKEEGEPQIYAIERHRMRAVRVFIEHVYTLGVSDYEAIRNAHPDIRCILSTQPSNQFGSDALAEARSDHVALFDYSALFGALHKDGEAFYQHVPRK